MNVEVKSESPPFVASDLLRKIIDGIKLVPSFLLEIINRWFFAYIFVACSIIFIKLRKKLIPEENEKKMRVNAEKIYSYIVFVFLLSWWAVFSYLIYLGLLYVNPYETMMNISKEELFNILKEISIVGFSLFSCMTTILLPTNLVVILLFVLVIGICLYFVYGSGFLSTKLKLLIGLSMGVLGVFGYNKTQQTITVYVKRIQKSIRDIYSKSKIVIPVIFSASFIISLQALLLTLILHKTPYRSVLIIPALLLSDWTYNIILKFLIAFFAPYFYQNNTNSSDMYACIDVVKQESANIIVQSLYTSLFSTIYGINKFLMFFNIESFAFIIEIEKYLEYTCLAMELRDIVDDNELYRKSINHIIKKQETEEAEEAEVPSLETTKETNFAESAVFYLLGFKNFAFRLPFLLAAIGMQLGFKTSPIFAFFKIDFLEKPLAIFENFTEKPNIPNFIGMVLLLSMILYVLMIPTVYFANKIYYSMTKPVEAEEESLGSKVVKQGSELGTRMWQYIFGSEETI